MFEAVKKYIKRGIPVFPCREKDESDGKGNILRAKSPRSFVDYTKNKPIFVNGFKDATCDYEICKDRWSWNTTKNSAIGMPTGKASGFTVIDLDRGHKDGNDGVQTWKELNKQHGTEPVNTTVVKTPSGGYHLYYQYEESVKCTNKLGKGIDIKNNGGYVILPPSKLLNGKYEFYNKIKPNKIHQWILDFFKTDPIIKIENKNYRPADSEDVWKALEKIDPDCEYQTWILVGMALKNWNISSGCTFWDSWSQKGSKYKSGECEKKWNTFSTTGVGIGSLIYLANKKE